MPPRQVKPDPEVKSQDSPDLSTIQPVTSNTTSAGTGTAPGLRLPNFSPTHPLPVIHESGESYPSSQFPGLEGTTQGLGADSFLYPDISGIGNIPNASQDPFAFNPTGDYNMNNMSRTILPSSGNARNQGLGNSGTGAGITKHTSRQPGHAGIATNQAVTRAALGMGVNPGQTSNQNRGFDVGLMGMDYPIGSSPTTGLYGSALNSGMDPNSFASSSYNPLPGMGGSGMQQNTQHQDYRNLSPVPKFDPDFLPTSPDFITPTRYESFGEEEEYETKPDPRRMRTEGTPTPAARNRRTSHAPADISPATANTSSPANSPFEAPDQGSGGGGGGSRGRQAATNNPPPYQAHVPPNRIAEAGPVTHPDPEWRPYGVNHWHVFLREPTTLKYLSSTEIKDIREHCYELAARGAGGDDDDDEGPRPVAEGSPYTTDDAQAVWKHCDAYVRRRGQVRNNQAARRSRQRKDAETRYWKAKALEYGAPDVEFDWSMVEDSPPAPQQGGSSSSSRPAAAAAEGSGGGGGGGVQTRARARGQVRAQQQQGGEGQAQMQGHGQIGRGGGRQRQAAAPSAAPPDFDFNQPLKYDEDDEALGSGFDAFTGEF